MNNLKFFDEASPLSRFLSKKRKTAFSPEAKNYGLPAPKGTLMLGFPGCVLKNTKIRVKKQKNEGTHHIHEE